MTTKFVYAFEEGNASQKALLGGKGAGLAEMTNIGLPVPQGITVTTEACIDYYTCGERISDEIKSQIFFIFALPRVLFLGSDPCGCRTYGMPYSLA